jgi:hypothetical protein
MVSNAAIAERLRRADPDEPLLFAGKMAKGHGFPLKIESAGKRLEMQNLEAHSAVHLSVGLREPVQRNHSVR